MVNIDALLSEWAYRCKKGYPDMDSPSDLRVLKTILKEQGISLPLAEDLAAAEQEINTKEIDSTKEFLDLIDKVDLSKEDIQKVSAMIIQFDPDFQLDEEKDLTNMIASTVPDLKDQVEAIDLSPEDIVIASSHLLSLYHKKEILDYFAKAGGNKPKAFTQPTVHGVLVQSMIESGDILKFVEYIKSPETFSKIFNNKRGSLIEPLKGAFSDKFLYKMISLDGAYGGTAIGKGEFFLCLVCSDIQFEGREGVEGDLDWNGKGLEIKNKGAKPTGQKASYNANSHDLIFKNLFQFFKQLVVRYNPNPSEFGYQRSKKKFISIKDIRGFKGFRNLINVNWPYKVKALYNEVLSKDLYDGENDKLKKEFIDIFASSFRESYKGLGDANVMDVDQYFNDSEFDADRFTLDWGIAVVEDYMESEGFDYVLFLNDNTYKYELFERDEIIEKLTLDKGKETYIYISPKDGLPRWSAVYTLTD